MTKNTTKKCKHQWQKEEWQGRNGRVRVSLICTKCYKIKPGSTRMK